MSMPKHVYLTEVGPRDGLQNEQQPVSATSKIELCRRLTDAGVRQFEAGSFVSPKWIPQMADSAQVMAGIERPAGSRVSVLAPNVRGLEGALASGADEVVIFGAASEAFSMRNINCSIAESIERFRPVAEGTLAAGLRLRAAVSVAFGCPYQGEVPLAAVLDVVMRMRDLGCHEIGIADTIGVGTAGQVARVFEAAAGEVPMSMLSGHFHDTYGQALANTLACLEIGIDKYDSSISGLGGCPYAKGATGNVATEDLVYMLHGLGIETGLDLDGLVDAGQWISEQLGRANGSRVGRALLARREAAAESAVA